MSQGVLKTRQLYIIAIEVLEQIENGCSPVVQDWIPFAKVALDQVNAFERK